MHLRERDGGQRGGGGREKEKATDPGFTDVALAIRL